MHRDKSKSKVPCVHKSLVARVTYQFRTDMRNN